MMKQKIKASFLSYCTVWLAFSTVFITVSTVQAGQHAREFVEQYLSIITSGEVNSVSAREIQKGVLSLEEGEEKTLMRQALCCRVINSVLGEDLGQEQESIDQIYLDTLQMLSAPGLYGGGLPSEMWDRIFTHLSPEELVGIAPVCSQIKDVARRKLFSFHQRRYYSLFTTLSTLRNLIPYADVIRKVDLRRQDASITDEELKILGEFSHLRCLSMGNGTRVTRDSIRKLPQGLRKLHLEMFSKVTGEEFKNLFKNLKHLYLDYCPITTEGLACLPQSLQTLNIKAGITFSEGNKCFIYNSRCSKNLPRNLKELTLEDVDIDSSGMRFLPEGLASLNLRNCIVSNNIFRELPSNLKKLYICGGRISNNDFEGPAPQDSHLLRKIRMRDLQSLPEELESLTLFGFDIYKKELRVIPKHLLSLRLEECGIDEKALKFLPKNIPSLTLNFCCLTDKHCKNFPEHIKELILMNGDAFQITANSLNYLPENLQTLRLFNFEKFSEENLKSLRESRPSLQIREF